MERGPQAARYDDHALGARLLGVTRSSKLVSKEIKHLCRARRREAANHSAEVATPSAFLHATLLLIFYLSGWNTDLAVIYWQKRREGEHRPPLPQEVLRTKFEDLFLQCDVNDLAELADPSGTPAFLLNHPGAQGVKAARLLKSRQYCRAQAESFLRKMRLRQWVSQANSARGVAPSTTLLVERYNRDLVQFSGSEHLLQLRSPATDRYARLWAHRWRRFVHGRWSKLRVQDYIDLEEKRDKA